MVITGVALKQHLTFCGWPHSCNEAAPIGADNGNKRRHIGQAERASAVTERAGKGRLIIQFDMAAVLATRAIDWQPGGSIHDSLLVQPWELCLFYHWRVSAVVTRV